ncbi:MAG: cytochrome C5 [Actinobacteria bacterium]|nr:cytochrome C5 [Actinomycetota bacterium]
MSDSVLNDLLTRVTESGLVDDPVIEDDVVRGEAYLTGADAEVEIDVDPEIDETDEPDLDALLAAVSRVLSTDEQSWRALLEEVATEIEDALEDEEIAKVADPRVDLEPVGVGVFVDAIIVVFVGEKQFPDALVHVQLTPELEVEDIEIVNDSEDDDED